MLNIIGAVLGLFMFCVGLSVHDWTLIVFSVLVFYIASMFDLS